MGRVAIVTDSASDLTAEVAAAHGIRVVPLYVRFGDERVPGRRRPLDRPSSGRGWSRPDAPFPTTAAASPGDFQAAFEAELAAGAEAIVCVTRRRQALGDAQERRARRAGPAGRGDPRGRLGLGLDGRRAPRPPRGRDGRQPGIPAAEIAARVRGPRRATSTSTSPSTRSSTSARAAASRRPGRRSPPSSRSSRSSPSPTGVVETADKVRTRAKARERVDRAPDREAGRADRVPPHAARPTSTRSGPRCWRACRAASTRAHVSTEVVGPSVGPHIGPGCVGARGAPAAVGRLRGRQRGAAQGCGTDTGR